MQIENPIIIAIDGFSSCGKSTLAKDIAAKLNYKYIDSGAMYRAVTLYCLEHEIDVLNENEVIGILNKIDIDFEIINGKNCTILNTKNVEQDIRSMKVSNNVSEIARIPQVREKLVALQRKMGLAKGIVMEGRDITTVVFPEAEIKVFVTAEMETRVERRFEELKTKGKNVTLEEVKLNLIHRDNIDTNRSHSPLKRHPDAYLLNNTFLNREEQVEVVLNFIANLY